MREVLRSLAVSAIHNLCFAFVSSFLVIFCLPLLRDITDKTIHLAIFPGYYTGRALHVHTKVFPEWEVLPNGTFMAGRLAHVGQFFFDDQLEAAIDKVCVRCTISLDVDRGSRSLHCLPEASQRMTNHVQVTLASTQCIIRF